MASHKLKQLKIDEAREIYSRVLEKNSKNVTALLGKLECSLISDNLEGLDEQFGSFEKEKMNENAVN